MEVCGINRARRRRYGGYTKYSPPTYWQKLGRTKAARTLRDSIAAKVGKACHTSKREARSAYIPLIRTLFAREDFAIRLSAELVLEEDEIAFLLDAKKTSKKVREIYEKSRDLIEQVVEEEIDAFARFGKYRGEFEQGEPRDALQRAITEEEKPPVEKSEKLEAPPKKRGRPRKSRDGGDEEEEEPVVEQVPLIVTPELAQEPVPEPETADKKRQKTLFEF
jgi:replication factor C large subunit